MPNIELARRVLTRIEQHPDQWDQEFWARETVCGTAYCFAGWAVKLGERGARFLYSQHDARSRDSATHVEQDRGTVDIRYLAMRLLDISSDQAEILFWHSNTFNDLRQYVRQLEETGLITPCAKYVAYENDEDWEDEDDDY